MSKEASCLIYIDVQNFIHFTTIFEETLKDFLCIIAKPIASFKLTLGVQSLFESLMAIFIEIGSFDRIREDLVGLGACSEHLFSNLGVFLSRFGTISQGQFPIGFGNLGRTGLGVQIQCLIVVCYHL